MLKLLRKSIKVIWKCENWKWPLVSLTSIISASTWPNVKSKDSFEILKQISKLTLLFKFGQVEAEILQKNKLPSFFVDTVYISVCGSSND